jgi:hypothetical protein
MQTVGCGENFRWEATPWAGSVAALGSGFARQSSTSPSGIIAHSLNSQAEVCLISRFARQAARFAAAWPGPTATILKVWHIPPQGKRALGKSRRGDVEVSELRPPTETEPYRDSHR